MVNSNHVSTEMLIHKHAIPMNIVVDCYFQMIRIVIVDITCIVE